MREADSYAARCLSGDEEACRIAEKLYAEAAADAAYHARQLEGMNKVDQIYESIERQESERRRSDNFHYYRQKANEFHQDALERVKRGDYAGARQSWEKAQSYAATADQFDPSRRSEAP
jgi:hypothetical protein